MVLRLRRTWSAVLIRWTEGVNRLAITSVGGEALARASAAIQPAMARILAAFGEDGAATIEPVLRQVYAAVLTLIQSKESS